jgi:hypothetical protein
MLDPELDSYARGIARALLAMGPTPRQDVLGMLVGLGLTNRDANAVLGYALVQRIVSADGDQLIAVTPPLT